MATTDAAATGSRMEGVLANEDPCVLDTDERPEDDDDPEEIEEVAPNANFDMSDKFQYEAMFEPKSKRARKQPLPADVVEAVERHKSTNSRTDLVPFGHRIYDSFGAFIAALGVYMAACFVHYRVRTAQTVADFNKKSKGEMLPLELQYTMRTWRCIHGIYQKKRGKGIRTPRTTRFTDCEARITAALVLIDGVWAVHSVSEVLRHNHKCSERIYRSYTSVAILLQEHELYSEAVAVMQSNAPTAATLDAVAMLTDVEMSAQELANYRRDRLGGRSALVNLRLLLLRFAAFDGSRCLIIQDQLKQVCGIVIQSAAQRDMFQKYGDNLILDWTHNTTNVGYYLGSLMVTSASGSGVSVLDFVCMTQTKEMMRAVFAFFIENNPGAATKPCSIVIDKDYTEWSILTEMFPDVAVLFCQFHAVKWFAQVVTDTQYGIPTELQDRVYAILHDMVYVRTTADFQSRRWLLATLLREVSPNFLAYMEQRWYSCRPMWSSCERGTFFTAINPTSNRIESGWGQVKGILGMKLRVDMCFQAIFMYATAVLRREIKLISEYDGPTSVLRSDADPFLRPVLAEISDYCAAYVKEQYEAHFQLQLTCVAVPLEEFPERISVENFVTNGAPRIVNTADWTCDCASYVTARLPCRHIMFVSRVHLLHDRLPLGVLPTRWLLAAAAPSISKMEKWVKEMQSLRVSLLGPSPRDVAAAVKVASEASPQDDDDYDLSTLSQACPSVAHVVLRRREVASGVVVDNLEKRNVADSVFEPLRAFLMAQSSHRFKAMATQMKDVFETLLQSWQSCDLPSDEADPVQVSSEDDDTRISNMVSESVAGVSRERLSRPTAPPGQRQRLTQLQAALSPQMQEQLSPPRTAPLSMPRTPVSMPHAALHQPNQLDAFLHSPLSRSSPPPVLELESDTVSVSSLGISHASSIIQAAAVQHAMPSWRSSATDLRADREAPRPTTNREPPHRVAPGSDKAAKRSAEYAKLDEGILTSMTLAMRPVANTTKKQRASAAAASARVATVGQRSSCPVLLEAFVAAIKKSEGISLAAQTLQRYPVLFDEEWLVKRDIVMTRTFAIPADHDVNFAIPQVLLLKLQTSFDKEAAREAATEAVPGTPAHVDLTVSSGTVQNVAKISGSHAFRGFTQRNLSVFRQYYDVVRMCAAYERDVAWVSLASTLAHADLAYPYPAFSRMGSQISLQEVAQDVIDELASCSLDTTYETYVDDISTTVKMSEVLGYLAGAARLNDAVLVFAMRQLASARTDIIVLDSLRPALCDGQHPFTMPPGPLEDYGAVVFPVNLTKSHWGLIVAQYNSDGSSLVLYDPLVNPTNHNRLRQHWAQYCLPFMRAWMNRDQVVYAEAPEYVMETPKQSEEDGANCGLYCIAVCTDMVARSPGFTHLGTLSESLISELRLRTLWNILCKTRKVPVQGQPEATKTLKTFATFTKALEKAEAVGRKVKAKAARRPFKARKTSVKEL